MRLFVLSWTRSEIEAENQACEGSSVQGACACCVEVEGSSKIDAEATYQAWDSSCVQGTWTPDISNSVFQNNSRTISVADGMHSSTVVANT